MHTRLLVWHVFLIACIGFFFSPAGVQAANLPLPSDADYENLSREAGKFWGAIRFKPAQNQSNITDYTIYFLDGNGEKIGFIGSVNVKKMEEGLSFTRSLGFDFSGGYYSLTVDAGEEIDIPQGAKWIGIYSKNASGESEQGITAYLWDNRVSYIQNARFRDTNPERGRVEGVLTWTLAPEAGEVKGFLVQYFDGEDHYELPAPYGRMKAEKGKQRVEIPPGMLPPMASSFYIRPLIEPDSGDAGPGASVAIADDISADTTGPAVTTSGVPVPENVTFTDSDPRPGILGGTVSWKADDDEFIRGDYSSGDVPFVYSLYFLDENDRKIKGIISVPRDRYEYGNYVVKLPDDLEMPPGARSIGVFVQLAASEGVNYGKVELRDDPGKDYYAKEARFVDEDPAPGAIKGKISWKASDGESDLAGYALFADRETTPFATVAVAPGGTYEAELPGSIAESGYKMLRIVPMSAAGEYLLSKSFQDARVQIADNTLAATAVEPGVLRYADKMFGSLRIRDEDPQRGSVGAVLTIAPPVGEGTVRWYFYDYKGRRIATIGEVDFAIEPNRDRVSIVVPAGTLLPQGAVYIGAAITDREGNLISEDGAMISDNAAANAVSFSDLAGKRHYAIDSLASLGIITGYNDGTFRPQETVTRAQFAAIVARAFRLPPQPHQNTFKDVRAGDWYAEAVSTAVHAGLLQGYEDGTFRPNRTITRKEMYMMVYRVLLWRSEPSAVRELDLKRFKETYADWERVPEWLYPALVKLNWYQLLPSEPALDPDRGVSREECAEMIYRLMTNMYSMVE